MDVYEFGSGAGSLFHNSFRYLRINFSAVSASVDDLFGLFSSSHALLVKSVGIFLLSLTHIGSVLGSDFRNGDFDGFTF